MASTLTQKMQTLTGARRRRIVKRADELIDQELSLRVLRKALDRTQVEVARKMVGRRSSRRR